MSVTGNSERADHRRGDVDRGLEQDPARTIQILARITVDVLGNLADFFIDRHSLNRLL